jgi:hypothetical protein
MAVNAEVQTLPRRGITLSPLGLTVLSVVLTGTIVMGVLVGRWTAPSTTGVQQAQIAAPGWVADANAAGYSGHLGFSAPIPVTGSDAWVPEAAAAGYTGRVGFSTETGFTGRLGFTTPTGYTGRLGFTTPDQGPASGWEGAAKDAGYTGHLGVNAG